MNTNRKELLIYFITTFGIAWALQVVGSFFAFKGYNCLWHNDIMMLQDLVPEMDIGLTIKILRNAVE